LATKPNGESATAREGVLDGLIDRREFDGFEVNGHGVASAW
jgi:hypothetical protein